MNSITSSTASTTSSSIPESPEEKHSLTPPLTELDARIQQIRQKCDELRKQNPKCLSLYEFGFAISVICAAAGIFRLDHFLFTFSAFIASIFWKTISRNKDRIKFIDGLEKGEIAQQRVLSYMELFPTKIGEIKATVQSYLESSFTYADKKADKKAAIQQLCRDIHTEIQRSERIDVEIQKNNQPVPDYRTRSFHHQLNIEAQTIQNVQKELSDESQENFSKFFEAIMESHLKTLKRSLNQLEESFNSLISNFNSSVMDAQDAIEVQNLLLKRWL